MLEWGIRFTRAELETCRPGDWLNWKEDAYDFLYGEDLGARLSSPGMAKQRKAKSSASEQGEPELPEAKAGFVAAVDEDEIKGIRTVLKDLLSEITSANDETIIIDKFNFREIAVWLPNPGVRFPFSPAFINENLNDLARMSLIVHLAGSGLTREQIRNCPECRKAFIIKRKPREDKNHHCSTHCARLAATMKYRNAQVGSKAEEAKRKDRERSHQHYVKKQVAKYGPNVKVARMPRKA
jgi:hypothetical protein